jgi:hypothetical protein
LGSGRQFLAASKIHVYIVMSTSSILTFVAAMTSLTLSPRSWQSTISAPALHGCPTRLWRLGGLYAAATGANAGRGQALRMDHGTQ